MSEAESIKSRPCGAARPLYLWLIDGNAISNDSPIHSPMTDVHTDLTDTDSNEEREHAPDSATN